MQGILKQINRSPGGLPKRAVEGVVMLHELGIEGDLHRNLKYHGGPDKAVLMHAAEVTERLKAEGFPVYDGALGENFTVTGMDPKDWRPGQRFRVGEQAVIELTTLRSPCLNLDVYGPSIKNHVYDRLARAGNPASAHWALGGFYARVLRTGPVAAGASIVLETSAA